MKIEISNGELLDKLSILEIKQEKIPDPEKLRNISKEYSLILPLAEELFLSVQTQYSELKDINRQLWDIEDILRDFEHAQLFGDSFIQAARKVYLLNDKRAEIKKEINLLTRSGLIEEKSYSAY